LTDLTRLLRDSQCVTLVGPGGIGKTRLAIEVADTMQAEFSDGVFFVPFASVNDGQSALHALALATGTTLSTGATALEQFGRDWTGRQALIVLDNCEHVLDVASATAEILINAGGGMRVLATSREPLRVPDEITYLVSPLALPAEGDENTAGSHSAAVQFFMARARELAGC
jgi:predicted ATPase